MPGRIWRQFGLLVWKNYLQQRRNLFWSIVEMSLPALFPILLLSVVRTLAPIHRYDNATNWEDFSVSVDSLPPSLSPPECSSTPSMNWFKFAYAPNNDAMLRVANDVIVRLDMDTLGENISVIYCQYSMLSTWRNILPPSLISFALMSGRAHARTPNYIALY